MTAPSLNNIDLSLLPTKSPDVTSIDLSTLGTAEEGGTARLEFSASGQGVHVPIGNGSATLGISSSASAVAGYFGGGQASLGLSATGSAYQDWVSSLSPLQMQEVYRLVITGAADSLHDLTIGAISSWQATSQAGSRSSYLQAVIPAADQYLDAIAARSNGELVIQKGYRLADGTTRYDEILRSQFDNLRPDRGRRALTITVSGYLPGKAISTGSRTLTGIRSISSPNGQRRVRCDIDLFLRPGMTVTALDESFRADYINYYVTRSDKFCEVGER